jgi:ATP-dependent DNA ligase
VTIGATWRTLAEKLEGREALVRTRAEGEVFKLISAPYRPGSSRQHKKYKYVKTLSAIVIGKGFKGHNSATLGLYDNGKIIEVGRASLNGKQDIEIGSIVEVKFLYFTGSRLYQPRIVALRTDLRDTACVFSQLKGAYKEGIENGEPVENKKGPKIRKAHNNKFNAA